MNRYIIGLIAIGFVLMMGACKPQHADEPIENYNAFIMPKQPHVLAPEVGIPFLCFPKKIGEIGYDLAKGMKIPEVRDAYKVTITIDASARIFRNFDKQNLSKMSIQYLDENNKLVIKELMDGSNVIEKTDWGYRDFFSDFEPIELTLKSGAPVYYALFYSPYAAFDVTVEVNAELEDGSESLPTMYFNYNRQMESFHVTAVGQEYFIKSEAMYLP